MQHPLGVDDGPRPLTRDQNLIHVQLLLAALRLVKGRIGRRKVEGAASRGLDVLDDAAAAAADELVQRMFQRRDLEVTPELRE
jgi:hypothetical protein